jgi:hypothetical protein
LKVNSSGRTSAAKLTGSWRKITDRPERWAQSVLTMKMAAYVYNAKLCTVAAYPEHHKTWCASPSRNCIRRIRTVRASLLSFLAPGDPYLQVSAGSVPHMTHGDWNEKGWPYSYFFRIRGRSRTCKADLRCDVEANHVDVCPRSENYIGCLRVVVDLQG